MRIAFDAKRAFYNNTGLGNYSRLIIDVMSEYYPDNEYLLFTPRIKLNKELSPILSRTNVEIVTPHGRFDKALSSLWRVWGISKKLRSNNIDLYHGLSNELPLNIVSSGISSIVTVHDLIFLRYPEYYKPVDRKIYDYKFRSACENSSRIIAISECTKNDIINFYNIPSEKIDVIYQGCDESFNIKYDDDFLWKIKNEYHLPDKFLLNVGTIERRKNVLLAIKSLIGLPDDTHLVIVGRETSYVEELRQFIRQNKLDKRVHFYTAVPFSVLPAFYQLADIFIYPSRFEGFGIPVLEALGSGTPVIAATGSCLEEAGGEHSVYVDPDDSDAVINNVLELFEDEGKRNFMIIEGYKYKDNFMRSRIAENIYRTYNKIL